MSFDIYHCMGAIILMTWVGIMWTMFFFKSIERSNNWRKALLIACICAAIFESSHIYIHPPATILSIVGNFGCLIASICVGTITTLRLSGKCVF